MKARLIKRIDNGWPVYSLRREDDRLIATTRWPFDEPSLMIAKKAGIELQKLSHENCNEIFGVTDVEKLAEERFGKSLHHANSRSCYKEGFNKAMELNKDKMFTVEDMHEALHLMNNTPRVPIAGEALEIVRKETEVRESIVNAILVSKQPTEIEVEIEMVKLEAGIDSNGKPFIPETFPKLDSKGCLILQKSNKEE